MKYVIDVEKIEGTNLWKAKEFNALVFDENGLMRMMTLEDELGDYYKTLREEIYSQKREIDLLVKTHKKLRDEKTELGFNMEIQGKEIDRLKKENEELKKYNNHLEKEWKEFDNICSRLKIENADLKVELKEYKAVCNVAFEDIEGLKNENKALVEQNSALEDEVVDFEELCTKLHNEKAELLEKINSLENKLLEKSVPIEEVVDKKYYNKPLSKHDGLLQDDALYDESIFIDEDTDKEMNNSDKFEKVFGYYATEMWAKPESDFLDWINAKYTPIEKVVDEERVVRLMTNQLEHSEREYGRLLHKIKCQKGMLKKQGKDISRLQKENKKLKEKLVDVNEKCRYIEQEKSWCNKEYIELKKERDKLIDRIYFGKDY